MNHLATYLSLIGLTIVSVLCAWFIPILVPMIAILVMGLAALKFILVTFFFMEMRNEHLIWKIGLISFSLLFVTLFSILETKVL